MSKNKQEKVLNYRVVVEKEYYSDKKPVFVAQVPTLGISDYGLTLEKALDNTEKLIKFHLECLIEEEGTIPEPDDLANIIVTTSQVRLSAKTPFAFA